MQGMIDGIKLCQMIGKGFLKFSSVSTDGLVERYIVNFCIWQGRKLFFVLLR